MKYKNPDERFIFSYSKNTNKFTNNFTPKFIFNSYPAPKSKNN